MCVIASRQDVIVPYIFGSKPVVQPYVLSLIVLTSEAITPLEGVGIRQETNVEGRNE